LTPIWFNRTSPSAAIFRSIDPKLTAMLTDGWPSSEENIQSTHATDVAKIEFKLGTIEVVCWEYALPVRYAVDVLWQVDCRTRPNGRDFNLYADFFGHKEDIPALYQVLRRAIPTD
jgi:hypothetical protein